MHRWVRLAALGFASTGVFLGHAADFRSRPPHVHGLADVDIALEASTLAIILRAPAINVIGFEHARATNDEKMAIARAADTFKAGDRLFAASPAAGCWQQRVEMTPITYEIDGAEEKPGGPEAEYEMHYRFTCSHPAQVTLLPGDERIAMQP